MFRIVRIFKKFKIQSGDWYILTLVKSNCQNIQKTVRTNCQNIMNPRRWEFSEYSEYSDGTYLHFRLRLKSKLQRNSELSDNSCGCEINKYAKNKIKLLQRKLLTNGENSCIV